MAGTAGALSGRQFSGQNRDDDDNDVVGQLNQIHHQPAADYDPDRLGCVARHFCERLKSRKYLLDSLYNTRKIGRWMVDR